MRRYGSLININSSQSGYITCIQSRADNKFEQMTPLVKPDEIVSFCS